MAEEKETDQKATPVDIAASSSDAPSDGTASNVPVDTPMDAPSDVSTDTSSDTSAASPKVAISGALEQVIEKIKGADSILVTLSDNPSVDEMVSALGLAISLDNMGKHVTAIYSGKTPNVIQFLEPEKTFEPNTNSLQDFIIALDKEKADHLRYKIEGNFVKVFITPYKTTISEKDLEFSRGEINVDLIICLNVTNTDELDAALQEHGRILHDASLINISNERPGQIGGTEWNDMKASSIAEMVTDLLEAMGTGVTKDVATALLTGIIAATNRFSSDKTTPETMAASAKLMQQGADQQLITVNMEPKKEEKVSNNIDGVAPNSVDADSADTEVAETESKDTKKNADSANADNTDNSSELSPEQQLEQMLAQNANTNTGMNNNLMQELAASSAELEIPKTPEAPTTPEVSAISEEPKVPEVVQAPEVPEAANVLTVPEVPTAPEEPVAPISAAPIASPVPEVPMSSESLAEHSETNIATPTPNEQAAAVPTAEVPADSVYGVASDRIEYHNGVIDPLADIEQPKDYGAMMEQALAEATPEAPAPMAVPATSPVPMAPEVPAAPAPEMPASSAPVNAPQNINDMVNQMVNQAQNNPPVPNLPVPPAPPVDMGTMPPAVPSLPPVAVPEVQPEQPVTVPEVPASPAPMMPAQSLQSAVPEVPTTPEVPVQPTAAPVASQDPSEVAGIPAAPVDASTPEEPVNPVVVQPVQDPALVPPVQDPGAFKIPGM